MSSCLIELKIIFDTSFRYHRMKKNIIISLLFLLLFRVDIFSQNITIKGKIKSESSSLVRLMLYNDMLTGERTTIYETKSDDEGDFVIEASVDKITPAQIAVGIEYVDIVLKPSSRYEVEIILPKQDEDASYFERKTPVMRMIRADDDDLYLQYSIAEKLVDDFVMDNFNQLYRRRQRSLLDSLDVLMNRNLGTIKNDFIKDYVKYRRANIQMVVDGDDAKNVRNQYFNNQKILYHQPAYMSLFHEIFSDYLVSRQFDPSELQLALRQGYDKLMTYVKSKDAFLSDNEELAEIIVAWNLKRMFYEFPDDRKYILNCLKVVGQNTKVVENKNVVDDILKQIERLSFNTDAPQFSLKDADGNIVNLSDYKDNMVLLQFVNKVSPMTDYQFQELNNISQYWPDMIKIVTITTDESFDDFKEMIEKNSYKWDLLKLGDDILLLEKYQIRTFPDYIILIPQNKIGMAPASTPDQYLDYHMKRIYNHINKK